MTYICHLFEASIHTWRLRLYCLVKNKAMIIYKWNKKYICDIKAKCVQTCLHQSMLSSPLLQVEPQRNCWKILSYFFYWWWGDIFLTSFIFELWMLLLEYAFKMHHVYMSHMQWWSIEYSAVFLCQHSYMLL